MTAFFRGLAAVAFLIAVPLALILGNVRWLVFNEGHYMRGYDRYRVRETTGMNTAELEEATRQIQEYFRGGGAITLQIQKETGRAPLFNERETAHLRDVRKLLDLLFGTQTIAVAYLPLYAAFLYRWYDRRAVSHVAMDAVGAGAGTLLVIAALGAAATANFDQLFVQFHLLSFDNDLWMLDPRTDYLIRMYPEGFWFDSAVQVALMTAVEAVLVAGAGMLVRLGARRLAAASPG